MICRKQPWKPRIPYLIRCDYSILFFFYFFEILAATCIHKPHLPRHYRTKIWTNLLMQWTIMRYNLIVTSTVGLDMFSIGNGFYIQVNDMNHSSLESMTHKYNVRRTQAIVSLNALHCLPIQCTRISTYEHSSHKKEIIISKPLDNYRKRIIRLEIKCWRQSRRVHRRPTDDRIPT